MGRTMIEKSIMTKEKLNSKKTVDGLVSDELLEMGFSYGDIGTHYLHDCIVSSTQLKLEDFGSVKQFCRRVGGIVCMKYNVDHTSLCTAITVSIDRAFDTGNINYLLETFKGSYDRERMKVYKNTFIMVVRPKIMAALDAQDAKSNTQLRLIIQGTVEKITDYALLKGISDIVLSLAGGAMA